MTAINRPDLFLNWIFVRLAIVLFISSNLFCYGKGWIRKLPDREYVQNQSVHGTFEKRTNPKSAMNSRFHKNEWKEWITFDSRTDAFEKTYLRVDFFGDRKIFKKIIGRGKYQTKGNWIILNTEEIARFNSEGEENIGFKNYSHAMLYHFDKNSDTIIPMAYESGYEEKSFGVIDGVKTPYEEDKYFFQSRRIYTLKDFQPHAYFRVK